jgi:hypothetical protein
MEIAILAIGLAMRDIFFAQFSNGYSDIPQHVANSSFPFSEYE